MSKTAYITLLILATFAPAYAVDSPGKTVVQSAAPSSRPTGITLVPHLEKPRAPTVSPSDPSFAGYLLVYFKDETHCAYLAISRDGYTFVDVNRGEPIFKGPELAEQNGVRDPHIARGPDGAFYLAMTDLHIYGQRAGFRNTEWERPSEKFGWGNNRALVLMKSYDLIHWTHSDFRVDTAFPELGEIDCAWAPESIFDPAKKKMMVYFTIRRGNRDAHIYYSYTNEEFTRLETKPERLSDLGGIDGDITKVGDEYHLFYVSDAKIRHAVSDRLTGGYVAKGGRIDPETVSTEAPNIFRRIGSKTYVLMDDVYGARPHNMGFSETEDFVSFRNLGHFNEGAMKTIEFERPKHGAIIPLTSGELKTVAEHWNVNIKLD